MSLQNNNESQIESGTSPSRKTPKGKSYQQLQSEVLQLKARLEENTVARFTTSQADIESRIKQKGKIFTSRQPVIHGTTYTTLRVLLEPLVKVVHAASLGRDITHRQPEMVIEDNRRTKEKLVDANGRVVYLPNQLDKLENICEFLSTDEACLSALDVISKRLENLETPLPMDYQIQQAHAVKKLSPSPQAKARVAEKSRQVQEFLD